MGSLVTGTPLQKFIAQNGTFPRVSLQIKPLDPSRKSVELKQFTDYSFLSSILVPVDAFSFSIANPTLTGSITDHVQDGDVCILKANGIPIATGLIDSLNVSVEETGERVNISGRTLNGMLEDQSCVNEAQSPIWGNSLSIVAVLRELLPLTRINQYRLQDFPKLPNLPLATAPGESKMAALIRYLEPTNCVTWQDPDGTIVVGRPNMGQDISGTLIMDRENRLSNVTAMQAHYSATQVQNLEIPVWTGQEQVTNRISAEQGVKNAAPGPKRLRGFNHFVSRCVIVSSPQGAEPQALAQSSQFIVTGGGSNTLQAYAKRELARANVNEFQVQCMVRGHYNDELNPFLPDTTYQIRFPRADVSEKMYLYSVEYRMSAQQGQSTSLSFCRLGSIVADIPIKGSTSVRGSLK